MVFALVLPQTKVKQWEVEYRTGEQVTNAHQDAKSPYSSSKPHLVFDFAGKCLVFIKNGNDKWQTKSI